MPTSLGIMQILVGPPPPPPPCDGCCPTPHETAVATSTASRAVESTFRFLIEPNTLLLLLKDFLPEYPLYPDMFYSSPLRKNSFRNTATRSRTPRIKSCQVLGTPARSRPLRSIAMMTMPSTVPPMVPEPP